MAKKKNKVIITAALTGSIHTPGMSPYLPVGIEGIAQEGIAAANAGAAVLHVHARKDNGQPTGDTEAFRQILSKINSESDAVLGITTGGAQGMTLEERMDVIPQLQPEIASCNTGTMTFCLSQLAEGLKPKYDWEVPFLTRTWDTVFKNSMRDIEYCIDMFNQCGVKPEFEVFDLGQLNNLHFFYKRGVIKPPLYIQFVPGVTGGFGMTLENLMFMFDAARKLFGNDVMFSSVSGGRRMFRFASFTAINGGNVRVGMEDGIYENMAGKLATSNAVQVTKMVNILTALDYEVATADEAREILELKGRANVKF
jgi:uncharacterized protein (DUF849 family)